MRGIPAYIVMPTGASAVKKRAVVGYGANVIECPTELRDSTGQLIEFCIFWVIWLLIVCCGLLITQIPSTANEIHKETAATFIHPSNNLVSIVL